MSQLAMFPMRCLNVTQGMGGSGSHRGTRALDLAGKDTGIDAVFAPFDGVIKKVWPSGNSVWLESLSPVRFADGTVDYCTVMLTHDNLITDLRVGQTIKQGQVFYQEGTAGFATGNHVHLEVARGRFTGTGWHQNTYGTWVLNNARSPHTTLWLAPDTIVVNGGGYVWKRTGETMSKDAATKTEVDRIYLAALGRHVDPSGAKTWTGKPMNSILDGVRTSAEWKKRHEAAKRGKLATAAQETLDKIKALVGK